MTRYCVRGSCGHRHRTREAAAACAARDARACRALGGGAYSDRRVWFIDEDEGTRVPAYDEEEHDE